MERAPQAPGRPPPPLPSSGNATGVTSDIGQTKFAIRVVSHDVPVEKSDSRTGLESLGTLEPTKPVSPSQSGSTAQPALGSLPSEREEPSRPPPPAPSQSRPESYAQFVSPGQKNQNNSNAFSLGVHRADSPRIVLPDSDPKSQAGSRNVSHGSNFSSASSQGGHVKSRSHAGVPAELSAELHYHHRPLSEAYTSGMAGERSSQNLSPGLQAGPRDASTLAADANLRPVSSYSSFESGPRGRTGSPSHSPNASMASPVRRSPDTRPMSYVDLLNVPYPQQAPAPINLDNAYLRTSVGNNASLLSPLKTLEMYRANVKKTSDLAVQYSFAIFMIETAQEAVHSPAKFQSGGPEEQVPNPAELVKEARQILQKLSERAYPFAQYYLADGYASGLFNKGKEDNDRAFPLFVAASKRGHAEAGYRAALCYEFGWGTRKDPLKAVQFYRQSASKNHPGAMTRLARACLTGDIGLDVRYKEGIKWLKRAAESADEQYNTAPYELGLLHETGYGDDVFPDEQYAAQLFTQAADLGHVEANFKLGDAYEHGKLKCPKDSALSIHFYNGAACRGYPPAMMALCAWYMVGAEPVLERDEGEAYEWAKKAAEEGNTFSPNSL